MTIDPDPNVEPEEPELYLTEEELERRRNPLAASTSRRSSRKDSTISRTSDGSGSSSEGDEGAYLIYLYARLQMGKICAI